jgi:hypothetical protein
MYFLYVLLLSQKLAFLLLWQLVKNKEVSLTELILHPCKLHAPKNNLLKKNKQLYEAHVKTKPNQRT